MSPSEKVRALLDERGIDHYDHENGEPLRDLSEAGADPATSWRMGEANVCAVPNKYGTFDLWIDHCTPEQAIAATVGTSYAITFAPTLDRPPETMVGESIFDGEGNHIGWITNTAAGAGTCTIVKTWTDSDYADHWRYSCSECGYQIEVGERDIATGNPTSYANFCWNCGRRCIGIKEVTE